MGAGDPPPDGDAVGVGDPCVDEGEALVGAEAADGVRQGVAVAQPGVVVEEEDELGRAVARPDVPALGRADVLLEIDGLDVVGEAVRLPAVADEDEADVDPGLGPCGLQGVQGLRVPVALAEDDDVDRRGPGDRLHG